MVKGRRIAVIPARGGSKRLPRKNLIDFFGKPLLAWTIEAALASRLFDRVLVSTDDPEIAETARAHGSEVPFLRQAHSDDHSTISDVAVHALRQVESKLAETFDTIALLQPTCPLRDAHDINAGMQAFEESHAPFQASCFRFPWMNPWWAFRRDAVGHAEWLFPDMVGRRSQDQPPVFGLTGALYVGRVAALLGHGSFYGPGQRFQPISWISAIDIDDETDLDVARAGYLVRQGGSH
jgi:CMP-N-acetylneuraminic acid synthetase